MRNGPDFICIGSQKAGTGWLYDILRGHRDCWLPPIKELHYFDNPFSDRVANRTKHRLSHAERKRAAGKSGGARDLDFLRRLRAVHAKQDPSIARYKDLFAPAKGVVTGDITPAYATLDTATVTNLAAELPDITVILVLREPIPRLWSHARMAVRQGRAEDITSLAAFREFCARDSVQQRSFQSAAIQRWRSCYGDRLRILFFDDLRDNPEAYFGQVGEILGIRSDPACSRRDLRANRKAKPSQPMPAEIEAFAREMLAEEYDRLAEMAGGHAIAWRERFRQR